MPKFFKKAKGQIVKRRMAQIMSVALEYLRANREDAIEAFQPFDPTNQETKGTGYMEVAGVAMRQPTEAELEILIETL